MRARAIRPIRALGGQGVLLVVAEALRQTTTSGRRAELAGDRSPSSLSMLTALSTPSPALTVTGEFTDTPTPRQHRRLQFGHQEITERCALVGDHLCRRRCRTVSAGTHPDHDRQDHCDGPQQGTTGVPVHAFTLPRDIYYLRTYIVDDVSRRDH